MWRLVKALIFGPSLIERDNVRRTSAQRTRRAFLLHFNANSINLRFADYMERIGFARTGLHVWAEVLREWREETNAFDTILLPIGRGRIEAVRFLKPWDQRDEEKLQILAQVAFGFARQRVFTMKTDDCSDEMRAALVDFVAFAIAMEPHDYDREKLRQPYLKLLAGPIDPTLDGWEHVAADWWEEQDRSDVADVLLNRLPAWNEPPFSPGEEDEP